MNFINVVLVIVLSTWILMFVVILDHLLEKRSLKRFDEALVGDEFIKTNYKKCTCGIGPWTALSKICFNCGNSLFGEKI